MDLVELNRTPASLGRRVLVGLGEAVAAAGRAALLAAVALCPIRAGAMPAPAAPAILVQPRDTAAPMFSPATLSVTATGAAPLHYQWLFYGQPIMGEKASTLVFAAADTNNIGPYRVVVSNAFGAVTSAVAVLSVGLPPSGVSAGVDQTVCPGDGVVFDVGFYGEPPFSYEWRHEGVEIPDAINSRLVLTSVTAAAAGEYLAVVSNPFGAGTSSVVRVTVGAPVPSILEQPQGFTVLEGGSAVVQVAAVGCSELGYQWRWNGIDQPEGTNAWFWLGMSSTVSTNHAGDYTVVVRSHAGAVTSQVATVVVRQEAPRIFTELTTREVPAGNSFNLIAEVTGGPPPDVQWYFNGAPIPGAASNPQSVTLLKADQSGIYSVVATNVLGSASNEVYRLLVLVSPPVFTQEPVTRALDEGGGVVFEATAVGTPSPVYQWQFNGQDIADATNSLYPISVLTTNDTGLYRVIARNEGGEAVSRSAHLEVVPLGPQSSWRWRRPEPQGNDLFGAAYGAGRLVAVGVRGTSVVTTNRGASWQSRSSGIAGYRRVAFGNGVFAAIADGINGGPFDPRLRFSTDGLNWTNARVDQVDFRGLNDLVFAGDRFVAVGENGRVMMSADGREWGAVYPNVGSSFLRLAAGDGLLSAILDGADFTPQGPFYSIATSTDAVHWFVRRASAPGYLTGITYGNEQFVISGYRITPDTPLGYGPAPFLISDGEEVRLPLAGNLIDVAFGGGTFVAVGRNGDGPLLLSSSDAVHWAVRDPAGAQRLFSVAFGGGGFLAVGNFGELLSSADGIQWRRHGQRTTRNLRSVAFGRGLYVAIGNEGLILTSLNGHDWLEQRSGVTGNLRGVEFGGGRFVVVGGTEDDEALTLTSDDGSAWESHPAPFADLFDVVYGNGRFVAVGSSGTAVTSPDGTTWQPQATGTSARFNGVTWGNGLFVALGQGQSILTSPDGVTWTSRPAPTGDDYLKGVVFGTSGFVAVGKSGTVVTSATGLTWESHTQTLLGEVEDVIFGGGRFLAVGEDGFVASSADGLTWAEHFSGCANDLRSGVSVDDAFVLVGNNETILGSRPGAHAFLRSVSVAPTSGLRFFCETEPGRKYRLQSSPDLRAWSDLLGFEPAEELSEYSAPHPPASPQQFFRIVSP